MGVANSEHRSGPFQSIEITGQTLLDSRPAALRESKQAAWTRESLPSFPFLGNRKRRDSPTTSSARLGPYPSHLLAVPAASSP